MILKEIVLDDSTKVSEALIWLIFLWPTWVPKIRVWPQKPIRRMCVFRPSVWIRSIPYAGGEGIQPKISVEKIPPFNEVQVHLRTFSILQFLERLFWTACFVLKYLFLKQAIIPMNYILWSLRSPTIVDSKWSNLYIFLVENTTDSCENVLILLRL